MSLGNSSIHQRGEIPEIVKLPNNRIRVVRRFQKFTREDVDNSNLGSLMGDFGALDTTGEQISGQGYTDCRLISVEVDTRFNSLSNADNAVLTKTYETLTSSFVEISDPTVEIEENGFKKITKIYRAVSGTTSSNTIGSTTLSSGEVLATSKIEDNTAFAELTETYLESGTVSIDTRSAPQGLPSTYTRTYTSRMVEPTSSGIAISRNVENNSGYKVYEYEFLEGATQGSTPVTSTGEILSYSENIEVREAGIVSGSQVSVSDGTLAVLNVVPSSIKIVSATVSIKLVTDNTVETPSAYNLSNTSASATIITSKKSPLGIEQGTSLKVAVFNHSHSQQARSFPNSYASNSGATGSISTPAQIIRDDDNIIGESLNEVITTSVSIGGATSAPATTGLYQEEVEPAFLDADGTQYYRKTSYTI